MIQSLNKQKKAASMVLQSQSKEIGETSVILALEGRSGFLLAKGWKTEMVLLSAASEKAYLASNIFSTNAISLVIKS